jgi:SAM-dependent methyltransferase
MITSTTNAGCRVARTLRAAAAVSLVLLAGCGTTQFEAQPAIPAPLVERIPVVVGVYLSPEFREKVYREDRDGGDVAIAIGKAQSEGFMRLMTAMFERAVPVSSPEAGAGTDPAIRGVIEPVLEDFAFVTPADSGTDVYAVSLRYRVNGYKPDGQFTESWTFTGYGAAASGSMLGIGTEALQKATQLALRDAGARLATELREQAIIRGLLPQGAPVPAAEAPPPQ